jgi:hypothetical protein
MYHPIRDPVQDDVLGNIEVDDEVHIHFGIQALRLLHGPREPIEEEARGGAVTCFQLRGRGGVAEDGEGSGQVDAGSEVTAGFDPAALCQLADDEFDHGAVVYQSARADDGFRLQTKGSAITDLSSGKVRVELRTRMAFGGRHTFSRRMSPDEMADILKWSSRRPLWVPLPDPGGPTRIRRAAFRSLRATTIAWGGVLSCSRWAS